MAAFDFKKEFPEFCGDPRRCKPERLRTVIRIPVRRA